MNNLDELINTVLDCEKAKYDFCMELAQILDVNIADISINVGTSTIYSTIHQCLHVRVNDCVTFTEEQLNKIPFSQLYIADHNAHFIFEIGEVNI